MKSITPTNENENPSRVRANVIAKRYDVSERCVNLWGKSGKIPRVKFGKTVRYDLAAVIAAIEGGAK